MCVVRLRRLQVGQQPGELGAFCRRQRGKELVVRARGHSIQLTQQRTAARCQGDRMASSVLNGTTALAFSAVVNLAIEQRAAKDRE